MPLGLIVDDLRVLLVRRVAVVARGMLQLCDRVGRPHMLLATHTESILAAGVQRVFQHRVVAEGSCVDADRLFGDFEHADAFDVRGRAGEIFVDQRPATVPTASKICAPVYDMYVEMPILDITLRRPLPIALMKFLHAFLPSTSPSRPLSASSMHGLQREIWMYRFRAISTEQREMMHFARRAGFHDQAVLVRRPLTTRCW